MTWYPIALLPPQYENTSGDPYSGAVLKAYAAGTSTNIAMATTYEGTTTAASFALNAAGYPVHNGAVIIPHVQENYKLALYPNQAAANLDSGAVWTCDDIQIAAGANEPFIQYFDGDGTNTTFTLTEDLGTDERILMVFADKNLPDYVSNGDFATDTVWTKGSGWTIAAGVATAVTASSDLTENAALPLIEGHSYTITYTITRSAGDVTPKIGDTAGVTRNSAGTYKETIIAGSTQTLTFTGNGFSGTVDDVTVEPTYAAKRQILRADEFTLTNNLLVLNEPAAAGTKNVIVFAPSLLLGAANNAAAAAAASEANALLYATQAAASAALAAAAAKFKPNVACATTANITLSGEQTIDGVLTSGSRVLVKNQSTASQNGVYVSAIGAWTRATDCDSWTELFRQAVFVNAGTVNANITYINSNEDGGTLGVTDVTWIVFPTYIPDGAVVTSKLASQAVTTDKIADGAVTVVKGGTGLSTLTAGYAMLGNGTDPVALLAPGADGNIMTAAGGAWVSAAPTAGVFDRQTFTSSGTWTKPSGYSATAMVLLEGWGAGGGGAYSSIGSSGGKGGDTSIGTLLTAFGGSGGAGGGSGGAGGGFAQANGTTSTANDSTLEGRGGTTGQTATGGFYTGGGGGADNNGGNRNGGNSAYGGGGGAGSDSGAGSRGISSLAGDGGTPGNNGNAPAGGGGGRIAGAASGSGGGGGSYKWRWIPLASMGATETITVGAGGAGAASAGTGARGEVRITVFG